MTSLLNSATCPKNRVLNSSLLEKNCLLSCLVLAPLALGPVSANLCEVFNLPSSQAMFTAREAATSRRLTLFPTQE